MLEKENKENKVKNLEIEIEKIKKQKEDHNERTTECNLAINDRRTGLKNHSESLYQMSREEESLILKLNNEVENVLNLEQSITHSKSIIDELIKIIKQEISYLKNNSIFEFSLDLYRALKKDKEKKLLENVYQSPTFLRFKDKKDIYFGNQLIDFINEFRNFILKESQNNKVGTDRTDNITQKIISNFEYVTRDIERDFEITSFKVLTNPEEIDTELENFSIMSDIKEQLLTEIKHAFQEKEEYKSKSEKDKNNIELFLKMRDMFLLSGSSGGGKTVLALSVAQSLLREKDHVAMIINTKSLKSTELLHNFFYSIDKEIRKGKKVIVVIDEAEAIFADRRNNDSHESVLLVTELLPYMQQNKYKNVCYILCTNYDNKIDNAFLRQGRMGSPIQIHLPDTENRIVLFESMNKQWLDQYNHLVKKTKEVNSLEELNENEVNNHKQVFSYLLAACTAGVNIPDIKKIAYDFCNNIQKHEENKKTHKNCIDYFDDFKKLALEVDEVYTNENKTLDNRVNIILKYSKKIAFINEELKKSGITALKPEDFLFYFFSEEEITDKNFKRTTLEQFFSGNISKAQAILLCGYIEKDTRKTTFFKAINNILLSLNPHIIFANIKEKCHIFLIEKNINDKQKFHDFLVLLEKELGVINEIYKDFIDGLFDKNSENNNLLKKWKDYFEKIDALREIFLKDAEECKDSQLKTFQKEMFYKKKFFFHAFNALKDIKDFLSSRVIKNLFLLSLNGKLNESCKLFVKPKIKRNIIFARANVTSEEDTEYTSTESEEESFRAFRSIINKINDNFIDEITNKVESILNNFDIYCNKKNVSPSWKHYMDYLETKKQEIKTVIDRNSEYAKKFPLDEKSEQSLLIKKRTHGGYSNDGEMVNLRNLLNDYFSDFFNKITVGFDDMFEDICGKRLCGKRFGMVRTFKEGSDMMKEIDSSQKFETFFNSLLNGSEEDFYDLELEKLLQDIKEKIIEERKNIWADEFIDVLKEPGVFIARLCPYKYENFMIFINNYKENKSISQFNIFKKYSLHQRVKDKSFFSSNAGNLLQVLKQINKEYDKEAGIEKISLKPTIKNLCKYMK